jgi:ABC-type proline/glycine betaine transport system substrate-binding protein
MMKKIVLFASGLAFISLSFTSCEALGDCKTCRQVTYINGAWASETDPAEYCGAALLVVETAEDFISGNERTTWECE